MDAQSHNVSGDHDLVGERMGNGSLYGRGTRRHGRLSFAVVLGACWVVGFLGLDRGRWSSLQIPLAVLGALLIYAVGAALRRHLADRRDRIGGPGSVAAPPSCVVVRFLGENARGVRLVAVPSMRPPALEEDGARPSPPSRGDGEQRVRSPRTRRLDYIPLHGS